jgi:glutamate-5-semialdehyde dehydrogenase
MRALAQAAKEASRIVANASTETKNRALQSMARALRTLTPQILAANEQDMVSSRQAGKGDAFIDRLALNSERVEAMASALEEIIALQDPIGQVTERWKRPNGLKVEKVRLPLGVVMMIYESRPNVTSDAAALCLKSGNATILRGGRESLHSNRAILSAIHQGLRDVGLPQAAVTLIPTPDHDALLELLKLDELIDLCIPRGGEGLIRFVVENARVPVVKHYKGVCHVFVDETADQESATRIIVNAKAQRPSTCNAAETLLVHRSVADSFLPEAAKQLHQAGVELRGCPTTVTLLERAELPVKPAKPEDFGQEFGDYVLAIRVVKDLDGALEHIAHYGSEHTEAILTRDDAAAERFVREVTASAVVVNASTRFNDGGELGLGAEIGISTSRLHAFGPMGLRELTSQKYVVRGNGQVRT